jgi:hypothetical protein
VRARDDAKADQLRARHRLSKFLLRQGVQPPTGVHPWSRVHEAWLGRLHEAWLGRLTFTQTAVQVVLEDDLGVVRAAAERVKRLEGAQCGSPARVPRPSSSPRSRPSGASASSRP